MACASESSRTRSVVEAGTTGGGVTAGALCWTTRCWATRCWVRDADSVSLAGMEPRYSRHQTITPLPHQCRCCLKLPGSYPKCQYCTHPPYRPLSDDLVAYIGVSGTLTSTITYGLNHLLEVITVHVSHHGIDYSIALPHGYRTSGGVLDVHVVRDRTLLGRQ